MFLPGDSDAGAAALAEALGWGDDLRALVEKERALLAAAAPSSRETSPGGASRACDTGSAAALEAPVTLAADIATAAASPAHPEVEAAAVALPSPGAEGGIPASASAGSVGGLLAAAATAQGEAAHSRGGYDAAVDALGLGVLADALRDVEGGLG